MPEVTVDPDVAALSGDLSGSGAQALAITLAENLEIEAEALRGADRRMLAAVDHGDRLDEMLGRLDDAVAFGATTVASYTFDSLRLVPIDAAGEQTGLALGFEAQGTVEEIAYDDDGNETGRANEPYATDVRAEPADRRAMAHRRHARRWIGLGPPTGIDRPTSGGRAHRIRSSSPIGYAREARTGSLACGRSRRSARTPERTSGNPRMTKIRGQDPETEQEERRPVGRDHVRQRASIPTGPVLIRIVVARYPW